MPAQTTVVVIRYQWLHDRLYDRLGNQRGSVNHPHHARSSSRCQWTDESRWCRPPLKDSPAVAVTLIGHINARLSTGRTTDILHTVVHHSSTATYPSNFIEIKETFCGRTDVLTYTRTDRHLRPTLLRRLRRVDLKMWLQ